MKGKFFIRRKDIKNAAQQTLKICCAAFFDILSYHKTICDICAEDRIFLFFFL